MSEKDISGSRRNFLKKGGAGIAAGIGAMAVGQTAAGPAGGAQAFNEEYDIVVVGGGGGGLPSALFSRWNGNKVLLLEKASTLGGTSFKAAYWYWVPNNSAMRAAGMEDSKSD